MTCDTKKLRLCAYLKPAFTAYAFVLLVICWLNIKVTLGIERAERPYIYEANYSLPDHQLIQATTLNYRTAAADMVWIGGVQLVAASIIARRKSQAMTDYANTVIALDPYFYKVYGWHSAARMLAVGYPSSEDIEAANGLLKVGMYWFPNEWRLPYEATVNYIGFNKDVDTQTRVEHLKQGIKFAEAAASMPGSPEIMASLSLGFRDRLQRMENEQSGDNAGEDKSNQIDRTMLIHLYKVTTNEQARESILNRLRRIDGSEALAEQFQRDAKKQKEWHRFSMRNYLPYDLFYSIEDPATTQSMRTSETEGPLNEQ